MDDHSIVAGRDNSEMRPELLSLLVCAKCGGELAIEGVEEGGELHEGVLRCGECGAVLPVASGIPRAVCGNPTQAKVGKAFSSQWEAYSRGAFERGTVYGRSDASLWSLFLDATGISEQALAGLVVLDAGCGPARISRQIAQRGAGTVVALDVSDAVDAVLTEMRDLRNLHAIQADLLAAPLRAAFDLVWSVGVIHHTNDAAEAFRALTRYVRPGGLLFVWVYPRNLLPFHWSNATQWVQAALSRLGLRRLPDSTIFRLANILSYPTVGLHRSYRAARRLPGLHPHTPFARESVRPLTRRTFHLIWNDALVPPHTSWHSEREVIGWFRAAGFTDIVTTPTRPLGVRGRAP
jgi:SAM-dependent methyltransferase/uncharacterized protein YbaR (Trm112 family)